MVSNQRRPTASMAATTTLHDSTTSSKHHHSNCVVQVIQTQLSRNVGWRCGFVFWKRARLRVLQLSRVKEAWIDVAQNFGMSFQKNWGYCVTLFSFLFFGRGLRYQMPFRAGLCSNGSDSTAADIVKMLHFEVDIFCFSSIGVVFH